MRKVRFNLERHIILEEAKKLNEDLKLDFVLFGKEIKRAGMDFDAPIKDLIQRDFKEYLFSGR